MGIAPQCRSAGMISLRVLDYLIPALRWIFCPLYPFLVPAMKKFFLSPPSLYTISGDLSKELRDLDLQKGDQIWIAFVEQQENPCHYYMTDGMLCIPNVGKCLGKVTHIVQLSNGDVLYFQKNEGQILLAHCRPSEENA
jgi:hypothetical protein